MPWLQVKLLMEDGWNLLVSSARINQKTVAASPVCLLKTRPNTKDMKNTIEKIIEEHNSFVDTSTSDQKPIKLQSSRFTQPSKASVIIGKYLIVTNIIAIYLRLCFYLKQDLFILSPKFHCIN